MVGGYDTKGKKFSILSQPSARLGSTQCIGAGREKKLCLGMHSPSFGGDEWTSSSCSPSPPEDKTFLPLGFFGLRYSPPQTLHWVSPSLVEEGFLPKKTYLLITAEGGRGGDPKAEEEMPVSLPPSLPAQREGGGGVSLSRSLSMGEGDGRGELFSYPALRAMNKLSLFPPLLLFLLLL